MGYARSRPSSEILSGATADVYFARASAILDREGLDPLVTMEVFCREEAVLCGIDEAKNLLGHVLASTDATETSLEALDDGDRIKPKEIVLRIRARYRCFALYETAFLGILAQSTGWARRRSSPFSGPAFPGTPPRSPGGAPPPRQVVDAAPPHPVISFGPRHV